MSTRTNKAGGLTFIFHDRNDEGETAKMVMDVVKVAKVNKLLGLAKQYEDDILNQLSMKASA